MKKIIKYALLACLPACLVTACTPMEDKKPDMGAIADIENIQYSIEPAGTTPANMKFNILTPGVVGIWNFGGATKVGVDITRQYYDAGTYSVQLAVYNKAGISTTKTITFEVTEDYPIDVINLTSKPWVWDHNNSGHIGNGPEWAPNPEWWVAGPNEQDPKVYDDTLKFHANGYDRAGNYELVSLGWVLCNEDAAEAFGVQPKPSGSVLVPYAQPAGQQWNLEIDGDTKTLTLSNGGFPSYVPNGAWATNRYDVLQLDENILKLRIRLGWGAFFMRFTHP